MVLAVIASAGAAAAQDASEVLNSNGTEFSDTFEQCKQTGTERSGDDNWTDSLDKGIEDVLRGTGLDTVATGFESTRCALSGFSADPVGAASTAAGNATSAFWGDPIGDFVNSLLEGNSQALLVIMSLWEKTPFQGSTMQSAVSGIFNMTYQLQFLLLAVSLMIAGTRMAVARNKGLGEGFEDVGGVMLKFILAGVALPFVVISLHMATDALSSQWLQSGITDPEAQLAAVTTLNEESGLGPALVLILVVWSLLGALAQFVALILREGLLIVIVGLLPLAAAASALQTGKQAFKQMIGFLVAALLFKPLATLMYVVVFWLASQEGASFLEAIASMILLGAAGFTLPALMKIVAPVAAAAVPGGSAAAMGAAIGGATGAVAGGIASGASSAASSVGGSASGGGSSSGYGGQYGAANGAVGPGGGGGGGGASSSGGASPSGAGAGTSTQPSGASGAGASGGAQPSGASGGGSLASAGAAALGGVAAVAGGTAALASHGAKASTSTESMISGALGSYQGQVH
ncbi:hypothetical protein [Rhodococcus sp. IEGM 1408]|uniref:hypothetical protein n=1 Tax=Rhodococcus sp. IEGM 1408 TaxID=3082220 RepID=UPI00295367D2|nr:hypothetical protein [Rhodococcus sp. IEGM 1408]MDV8002845.1 hypothetical protein [Rhodococcus sp. IEGM 1408]